MLWTELEFLAYMTQQCVVRETLLFYFLDFYFTLWTVLFVVIRSTNAYCTVTSTLPLTFISKSLCMCNGVYIGMYAEFVSGFGGGGVRRGGGGGEWGEFFRSLLWFNITLITVSSVQGAQVPLIFRESRPTCTTELTKITLNFFFLPERWEGNSHGKRKCYGNPPKNTQTNPMSVRGELAATRLIVCNFPLPSPWPWVIEDWMIAKAHWGEQQLELSFWFWNY